MKRNIVNIAVLILAAFTAVYHRWLEAFGFDPDHGNGSAETLIVLVCVLVVIASAGSLMHAHNKR